MTLRTQLLLARIKDKFSSGFEVFLKIFQPKNKKFFLVGIFLVVILSFVFGCFVFAEDGILSTIGDYIMEAVAWVLYQIAYALGWLAMKIFLLVVLISSYNEFVTSEAVTKGWVIIRDVCNMLIVLMLLIYAFASILRLPKLSDPKFLPRLLIAAVLVNFSKLFCGIMIDLAQVFMMTFVNGYAATAGANLIKGLGLEGVLSFNNEVGGETIDWANIGIMLIFAIIFLLFTIVAIGLIVIYLLLRIVVLWILVVLSPLGFLSLVDFPRLSDYTKKWWDYFFNYIILGPIIAFFLWLSLLVMSDPQKNIDKSNQFKSVLDESQKAQDSPSEISEVDLASIDRLALAAIGLALLYASIYTARITSSISAKAIGGFIGRRVPVVRTAVGAVSTYRRQIEQKRAATAARLGEGMFRGREKVVGRAKQVATLPLAAPIAVAKGIRGVPRAVARAKEQVAAEGLGGIRKGVSLVGKSAKEIFQEGVRGKPKLWFKQAGSRERQLDYQAEQKKIDERKRFYAEQAFSDEDLKANFMAGDKYDRLLVAQNFMERGKMEQLTDRKDRPLIKPGELGKITRGFSEPLKVDFMKKVKENNAHYAYDLNKESDQVAMRKDFENGNINIKNQSQEFIKDERVIEQMYKGLGPKKFESAIRVFADQSKAHSEAAAQAVTNNFNIEVKDNKGQIDNRATDEARYQNRKVHADITGKAVDSFRGDTNLKANLSRYFKEAKVVNYGNIDNKQLASLGANVAEQRLKDTIKGELAKGLANSTSKLVSLMKKGESDQVRGLLDNSLNHYNSLPKGHANRQIIRDNFTKLRLKPEFQSSEFDDIDPANMAPV